MYRRRLASFALSVCTALPAAAAPIASVGGGASPTAEHRPAGTDRGTWHEAGSAGDGGIHLAVTVAEDNGDPAQCGTDPAIDVIRGHRVNYCYVVTNDSGLTLDYHTLSDTVNGALIGLPGQISDYAPDPLAPGASRQYNHVAVADRTVQPVATWTAYDALPRYTPVAGSAQFIDVSSGGTPLYLGDEGSAVVQMPFAFAFYASAADSLCISNNGFVLLGGSAESECAGFADNVPWMPFWNASYTATLAALEPFWDDLGDRTVVYYATLGEAPERRFVVEWYGADHTGEVRGGDYVTFEIVFDEATDTASFNYQNVSFNDPAHPEWDAGGSATVQIESDVAAGLGTETIVDSFSYDAPALSSNSSIAWSRTPVTSYAAQASADVRVAAPAASVDPPLLSAAAAPGATAAAALSIANTGDAALAWTIGSVPGSRMHFPAVPAVVVPMHARNETHLGRAPPPARKRAGMPAPRLPFGATTASAYAQDLGSRNGIWFVRWPDVATPATVDDIGYVMTTMYGGDFIDNDFDKEYAVTWDARLITIGTAATGGQAPYSIVGALGDTGPTDTWTGLKWDAATGTLFGVRVDAELHSFLYAITPDTAVVQRVGALPDDMILIDIAIDAGGHMYGLDIGNDALVAIDKTSGDAQPIGSVGFNAEYAQGMDFDDASGILYLAGFDGDTLTGALYTVDTLTGLASPVGPLGAGYQYDAFAIAAPTPGCAQPGSVPWLTVDPSSGTTAPGAASGVTVTLDATALTDGLYTANLCVHNNGAARTRIAVPVQFTVGSGESDPIFRDGFDGFDG